VGLTPIQVKEYIATIRNLFTAIEQLPKPVIAAINGVALGGGTELALAADIRIAADHASLGLTETRLAIIPGAGGTQRLPRLVGKGKAKELIFTGQRIDAAEALRIGLVNKVCRPEDLMDECRKMAALICETGPIAIEQAKYAISTAWRPILPPVLPSNRMLLGLHPHRGPAGGPGRLSRKAQAGLQRQVKRKEKEKIP
jgi:enoyl-CoA hydratase/carnithine racemase